MGSLIKAEQGRGRQSLTRKTRPHGGRPGKGREIAGGGEEEKTGSTELEKGKGKEKDREQEERKKVKEQMEEGQKEKKEERQKEKEGEEKQEGEKQREGEKQEEIPEGKKEVGENQLAQESEKIEERKIEEEDNSDEGGGKEEGEENEGRLEEEGEENEGRLEEERENTEEEKIERRVETQENKEEKEEGNKEGEKEEDKKENKKEDRDRGEKEVLLVEDEVVQECLKGTEEREKKEWLRNHWFVNVVMITYGIYMVIILLDFIFPFTNNLKNQRNFDFKSLPAEISMLDQCLEDRPRFAERITENINLEKKLEKDTQSCTAYIKKLSLKPTFMEAQEYEDLCKIVEAEAGTEDNRGRRLVANVILNRVKNEYFPDTIHEVVYQYENDVPQFSPVDDGRIHEVEVTEETIQAVGEALNGMDDSQGALYFVQRESADEGNVSWFDVGLKRLFKHGAHEFYTSKDEEGEDEEEVNENEEEVQEMDLKEEEDANENKLEGDNGSGGKDEIEGEEGKVDGGKHTVEEGMQETETASPSNVIGSDTIGEVEVIGESSI